MNIPLLKKRMRALCNEAVQSAEWREHTMGQISYVLDEKAGSIQVQYACLNDGCDGWLQVLSNPQPNQINISGTAVAMNCPCKET